MRDGLWTNRLQPSRRAEVLFPVRIDRWDKVSLMIHFRTTPKADMKLILSSGSRAS